MGPDAAIEALEDGRAADLYVAASFEGMGTFCEACQRLTPREGVCPRCGGPTVPVADLRERLVDRAHRLGATTEIFSGDAAGVLLSQGGVAVRLRY
jgi:hypothetical protein